MRFGGQFAIGLVRRAFIELHGDVAVERGLNLHAHLWRHEQFVAVNRRGEMHTLFGDLAHRTQTPHLKTATVGQDGFVPLFEAMQTAKALHYIQAGSHPQMEGIAQNDLRAHFMQAPRHHSFDRAVSAHGHKNRRLDHALVQSQTATAGKSFGF